MSGIFRGIFGGGGTTTVTPPPAPAVMPTPPDDFSKQKTLASMLRKRKASGRSASILSQDSQGETLGGG